MVIQTIRIIIMFTCFLVSFHQREGVRRNSLGYQGNRRERVSKLYIYGHGVRLERFRHFFEYDIFSPFEEGGVNGFSFVHNNPHFFDLSGYMVERKIHKDNDVHSIDERESLLPNTEHIDLRQLFPSLMQEDIEEETVGAGQVKTVHRLKEYEGYVVAKLKPISPRDLHANAQTGIFLNEIIPNEINHLNRLKELRFPVVQNHGLALIDGGQQGLILDYIDEREGVDFISKLNKTSMKDLKRVEALIKKTKIDIHDLQFLVKKDGHLLIHDPRNITDVQSPSDTGLESLEVISKIRKNYRSKHGHPMSLANLFCCF